MDVLVIARHPGGGIRTYISYVYGHDCMQDVELALLTPQTTALQSTVAELPNCNDHFQTQSGLREFTAAVWKVIRKKRPDLIHSHGFTAGLVSALPAKVYGIPHIITTHDIFLDNQFPGYSGAIKRLIIGRVLALATIINPVGEDAADNLFQTYPYLKGTSKVAPIRNGITTARFLTDRSRNLRSESNIGEDVVLIGFFGRFMAQKGFQTLVDAVDQWNSSDPKRKVNVACFGWGGFIREEQSELQSRGLEEHFHFFPQTDDMPAALRGVDVVVMPSRWEACPLLPMEAMVAGVPLIGTRCMGLKEVAEDTPVMLFDVGSVEQLLRMLQEFVAKEAEIVAAFGEFRSKAADRFDVEHTAHQLRALYTSLVSL